MSGTSAEPKKVYINAVEQIPIPKTKLWETVSPEEINKRIVEKQKEQKGEKQ